MSSHGKFKSVADLLKKTESEVFDFFENTSISKFLSAKTKDKKPKLLCAPKTEQYKHIAQTNLEYLKSLKSSPVKPKKSKKCDKDSSTTEEVERKKVKKSKKKRKIETPPASENSDYEEEPKIRKRHKSSKSKDFDFVNVNLEKSCSKPRKKKKSAKNRNSQNYRDEVQETTSIFEENGQDEIPEIITLDEDCDTYQNASFEGDNENKTKDRKNEEPTENDQGSEAIEDLNLKQSPIEMKQIPGFDGSLLKNTIIYVDKSLCNDQELKSTNLLDQESVSEQKSQEPCQHLPIEYNLQSGEIVPVQEIPKTDNKTEKEETFIKSDDNCSKTQSDEKMTSLNDIDNHLDVCSKTGQFLALTRDGEKPPIQLEVVAMTPLSYNSGFPVINPEQESELPLLFLNPSDANNDGGFFQGNVASVVGCDNSFTPEDWMSSSSPMQVQLFYVMDNMDGSQEYLSEVQQIFPVPACDTDVEIGGSEADLVELKPVEIFDEMVTAAAEQIFINPQEIGEQNEEIFQTTQVSLADRVPAVFEDVKINKVALSNVDHNDNNGATIKTEPNVGQAESDPGQNIPLNKSEQNDVKMTVQKLADHEENAKEENSIAHDIFKLIDEINENIQVDNDSGCDVDGFDDQLGNNLDKNVDMLKDTTKLDEPADKLNSTGKPTFKNNLILSESAPTQNIQLIENECDLTHEVTEEKSANLEKSENINNSIGEALKPTDKINETMCNYGPKCVVAEVEGQKLHNLDKNEDILEQNIKKIDEPVSIDKLISTKTRKKFKICKLIGPELEPGRNFHLNEGESCQNNVDIIDRKLAEVDHKENGNGDKSTALEIFEPVDEVNQNVHVDDIPKREVLEVDDQFVHSQTQHVHILEDTKKSDESISTDKIISKKKRKKLKKYKLKGSESEPGQNFHLMSESYQKNIDMIDQKLLDLEKNGNVDKSANGNNQHIQPENDPGREVLEVVDQHVSSLNQHAGIVDESISTDKIISKKKRKKSKRTKPDAAYFCYHCKKKFSTWLYLEVHQSIHRPKTLPYACPSTNCYQFFSRQKDLTNHFKSHSL